MPYQSSFFL